LSSGRLTCLRGGREEGREGGRVSEMSSKVLQLGREGRRNGAEGGREGGKAYLARCTGRFASGIENVSPGRAVFCRSRREERSRWVA